MPLSRARTVRIVAGATIALLAAGGIAAAALVPWPQRAAEPVSLSAAPPASASLAVCSGPVVAAGRSAADAAQLTDAAATQPLAAAAEGEPAAATLSAPDVQGGAGPLAYVADPVDDRRIDLAAAEWTHLADTDLTGLTADGCTRPLMESWLVGGAATTGAADLVTLANPGTVPARVTLTVYGAQGAAVPAAGSDVLVAPGSQRVIPLASLALGEESPVIQVTAAEAPVRAALQASITRVLLPGGVDQVVPAAAPAPQQVIPGVRITQDAGVPGDSEVPAFVRLVAPSQAGAATVTVVGEQGVVRDPQTVDVLAGVPLQLDLDSLPAGTYSVRVDADVPVTGAVWATTGFGDGDDFAWYAAADALTAPTLFAVAGAPEPTLTLVATSTDAAVELTSAAGAGPSQTVAVPAGGSVTVPVDGAQVYRLDPGAGGDVRAAVSFGGAATGLAGYTVAPGDVAAAAIIVHPR